MAQQFIDFGTFPNDPTADPLRAAFQKIQDNFTDIYNTQSQAGVLNLTVGAGLKQIGGTTGNILIISNIPSITITTANSLLVGVGVATSNTATITSSNTSFKLDLASTITTTNANFAGLTKTSNLQVSNYVGTSLVPSSNVTYDLGTANLRWRDLYLSGSTLLLGPQTIGANATSVNLSNLTVASNITVGNINITGTTSVVNSTVTLNLTTSNLSVGQYVTSNLYPVTTETQELGNSTQRWKSLATSNTGVTIGSFGITANATGIAISGNTALANVSASSANLGNSVTANYVIGNAAYLTAIPSANLVGQVVNASRAGTVYTGAQPNITQVGTLSTLTVNGNLNALTNLIAGKILVGSILGNLIPESNVTYDLGSPTKRWRDLYLSGNTLRIGSTVISSDANGTATISGGVVATSLEVGTVTSTYIGGTLTNPTQPNITSVGVLQNLAVTGNLQTGEMQVTGNLQTTNLTTTGVVIAESVQANIVPVPGVPVQLAAPGENAQILFNQNGNTSAVPGMTFDIVSSLLTIQGNVSGGNINSSGGLNVSGNAIVGNINTADINATGNVSGANLTLSGSASLSALTSSGNINSSGSVIALGIVSATGNLSGGNVSTTGFLSVTGNASVGNITTQRIDGTLVSVSGNVSGANLVASGVLSVQGSATVGNLITAALNASGNASLGNVSTGIISATGNIVGANVSTSGSLNVTGNANVGNLFTSILSSNSLTATGNVSGANLVASGILSVTGTATVGGLSTGGSAIVGLLNAVGNVIGANITSNGALTVQGSASISGNHTVSGNANITGNVTAGNINGGTFTATLFSGSGANLTAINGANITGAVGTATFATSAGSATTATTAGTAGTVTTAAQPSITSLGTLTGLTVSGAFSGSNISTSGYMLSSVGTGIAAAGTTLAAATTLTKQVNVIGTVNPGTNDAVKLPGATVGMQIIIINATASACNVFPQNGSTIDTLATNAAFPLGAGARLMVVAAGTTQWYTMVGVYG